MTPVGACDPHRRQSPFPPSPQAPAGPVAASASEWTCSRPERSAGNLRASPPSSSPPRDSEVPKVSIDNLSRLEVSPSPKTPTRPRALLGGWVNRVSKNAFERANHSDSLTPNRSFRENGVDQFPVKKSAEPYRDSNFKRGGNSDF